MDLVALDFFREDVSWFAGTSGESGGHCRAKKKVGGRINVNQTNLSGKLRKNWGEKRGPSKNLGAMAHPGPPLESPLAGTLVGLAVTGISFKSEIMTRLNFGLFYNLCYVQFNFVLKPGFVRTFFA